MNYSELVDQYIKNSGLSLAEITKRMEQEKGVKVDRSYISKLRNNPKYAASDEINQALAEVTGGDVNKLVWAGLIFGSHPSVRDVLMLIDNEVIIKAMNLNKIYPGYFKLSEEKQEELENDPSVRDFWDSLSESMSRNTKKSYKPKKYDEDDNSYKLKDAIVDYIPTEMQKIPVLGFIQAGSPIEMIEHNEGYTLVDPGVLKGKNGFALKVKGDSMIGDRIHEGDIVIVAQQEEVQPHEIAVVAVNGDYATLKRVKHHGEMCMLVPSNPMLEPQLIPSKDVHIIGKVVEVKFWPK